MHSHQHGRQLSLILRTTFIYSQWQMYCRFCTLNSSKYPNRLLAGFHIPVIPQKLPLVSFCFLQLPVMLHCGLDHHLWWSPHPHWEQYPVIGTMPKFWAHSSPLSSLWTGPPTPSMPAIHHPCMEGFNHGPWAICSSRGCCKPISITHQSLAECHIRTPNLGGATAGSYPNNQDGAGHRRHNVQLSKALFFVDKKHQACLLHGTQCKHQQCF